MGKWIIILIVAVLVVAAAGANAAPFIGVNFIGDNNGGGGTVTGIAGYISQANWNNVAGPGANNGSGVPLIAGDGSATGATLAWSSPNLWASGQPGQNQNGLLFQGYLDNSPTQDSNATITGLPPSIAGTGSTPYTVIVYAAGDNGTDGRGGNYTVNGTTIFALESGPSPDGIFVEGINYMAFQNVIGTTLTINVHPTMGGTPRAPFDGFQVFRLPEPGLFGLLGCAILCLGTRRSFRTR